MEDSFVSKATKGATRFVFGKVMGLNTDIRMKAALAKKRVMDRADTIARAAKRMRKKYE